MCVNIPERAPLIQHLNETIKSLLALLLAEHEQQTFLSQHCMLLIQCDSKLPSFIGKSHMYAVYEQLYKHRLQLQYDFSNILDLLGPSLTQYLLTRISNKTNLLSILQQSFTWKLDEEALFMDLFKLALPQVADPRFYQQILTILVHESTIPDDFDLLVLDKHLTTGQPFEAYYYDLRILLVCTAILVAKHPQIRYVLQHTRSFEQDLELLWKINCLDYALETTLPEK